MRLVPNEDHKPASRLSSLFPGLQIHPLSNPSTVEPRLRRYPGGTASGSRGLCVATTLCASRSLLLTRGRSRRRKRKMPLGEAWVDTNRVHEKGNMGKKKDWQEKKKTPKYSLKLKNVIKLNLHHSRVGIFSAMRYHFASTPPRSWYIPKSPHSPQKKLLGRFSFH